MNFARISSAGLGPGERLTALVPGGAEAADCGDEVGDAGEVTTAQRLALHDREEHLWVS